MRDVLKFLSTAQSDAGAGFGAVFPYFKLFGSLPHWASIFTADLSSTLLGAVYPKQV